MMKTCSVDDCIKVATRKGYCQKHYVRFKKYGNPLYSKYKEHRMTNAPEYRIWADMIQRCYNPKHKYFPRYGGRGITVCDCWKDSFVNFYKDMGDRPFSKAQLDREKNDQGYNKDNCRWVTAAVNTRNNSTTKLTIEKARNIRKKYKTGNYTMKELGIEYNVAYSRINEIINNKAWKEQEIKL